MAQVNMKKIYDASGNMTLSQRFKAKNVPASEPNRSSAVALKTEVAAPHAAARHKKPHNGDRIVTKKVPAHNKTFPAVLIIFSLIITSMVMLMVFNYARQYDLTIGISKQETKIANLNSEIAKIEDQITLELKSSDLENYSKTQLGYVPKEELSSRVVSAEHKDTVTVIKNERGGGGFDMLLSSLYGAIKNIFE